MVQHSIQHLGKGSNILLLALLLVEANHNCIAVHSLQFSWLNCLHCIFLCTVLCSLDFLAFVLKK